MRYCNSAETLGRCGDTAIRSREHCDGTVSICRESICCMILFYNNLAKPQYYINNAAVHTYVLHGAIDNIGKEVVG